MEKIRTPISDYTPFEGAIIDQQKKLELVYFISPFCDGACTHCWSANTHLGRPMPLSWHRSFWSKVDPERLSVIKLSGGETLLYQDLGAVIRIIRQEVGRTVPIIIFTSGRQISSIKDGEQGITETRAALQANGLVADNVEVHMSADELHASSFYRHHARCGAAMNAAEELRHQKLGMPMLKIAARNFLLACQLEASAGKVSFRGGKLKVHAAAGRLAYHRSRLFGWMDQSMWRELVISSEGLIKAGRASSLAGSVEIRNDGPISLFLLPGAEFLTSACSGKAQAYRIKSAQQAIYLDSGTVDGPGAAIVGWWNLINRHFCGGTANDALSIIGK